MNEWIPILLPYTLLLARTTAFLATVPLFGWRVVPTPVLAGLALWISVLLAGTGPPPAQALQAGWLGGVLTMAQEVLTGLALGLAVRFVFQAVQQGGFMAAQQMGMTDAGVIDPVSGDEEQTLASLLETVFAVFFLTAGGHHLSLLLLSRSFEAFPVAGGVDPAVLAEGLVKAGSAMMLLALKLAAPMLAAFLVLAVVLAILARILPELNVLIESFPLRVGLGLFMTTAMMPTLSSFADNLGQWMNRLIS